MICVAETLREAAASRIEDQARKAKVPCEALSKSALDRLAKGLNHQGVIAVTGDYPYVDPDSLIEHALMQVNSLIVALDQVQDPRNLGAIIRSVYAFGANGVIITRNRSAMVTGAAVRASVGTSELVRICRVTNLVHTLDLLRDKGFFVFGATSKAPSVLSELSWKDRTVLVLGNESSGLRRLTAEHCDRLFSIPLVANFDSLNVSAAAAISLYEAARQRFPYEDGAAK
jgi:23S rRNA (guanosine2251-2'-O)-methyltransferase